MPANPATGDKASDIKIDKVTVFEADFDRLKSKDSEDLPRFAKMKDRRDDGGDDDAFAALALYGIPRCRSTSRSTIASIPPPKCSRLNTLEVSLRGRGGSRSHS